MRGFIYRKVLKGGASVIKGNLYILLCLAALMPACHAAASSNGLEAARSAVQDGFHGVAEDSLRRWLKDRTDAGMETRDGVNLYLRSLEGQGKVGEIRRFLRESHLSSGLKDSGVWEYWTSYCDYSEGLYGNVTNTLGGFAARHGAGDLAANALRLSGWSYLALGLTNKAVECFQQFDDEFRGSPGAADNIVQLGRLVLDSDDSDAAVALLERFGKTEPDSLHNCRGMRLYGEALNRAGRYEESKAVLQKIAANEQVVSDIRADAFFGAAEAAAGLKDLPGAAGFCRAGLKIAQDAGLKLRGSIMLGNAALEAGMVEEGVAILKSQIVAMTNLSEAAALQFRIASVLLENSKNDQALGEFQSYLETFTNTAGVADAYYGKGMALSGLKRFAESAGAFSKAYDLSAVKDQKEESLFKMGEAYSSNGQFKLALETFDLFMREYPGSELKMKAYFQMAEALASAGRDDEAEARFAEIIAGCAGNALAAESRLQTAKIRAARKDLPAAFRELESVMKEFAGSDYALRALQLRSRLHFAAGDYESALNDIGRILDTGRAGPDAEDAIYEKGLCLFRLGRSGDAAGTFAAMLEKYPQSRWVPDVLFWQGEQAFNAGNFEQAETVFLGFANSYSGSINAPDALLRAGMSASGRKEYVRAIECFNRLAKEYPSSVRIPDARFAQANALCELGRFSEAVLPLDEVINKYPDSTLVMHAWTRKGDCNFVMGSEDPKRYEEAIQCYRVAASSSRSGTALVLQSEFKAGRSLQKLGRENEALDRYYSRVMVPFLEQKTRGEQHSESSRIWFTRASFAAADILEAQKEWKRAAMVLDRLAETGIPASREAGARAKKLRVDYWWHFY